MQNLKDFWKKNRRNVGIGMVVVGSFAMGYLFKTGEIAHQANQDLLDLYKNNPELFEKVTEYSAEHFAK